MTMSSCKLYSFSVHARATFHALKVSAASMRTCLHF